MKMMTASQRYRARLRGEDIPLRRRKWTPQDDIAIKETYKHLKRGDGQMLKLCELLHVTPDKIQSRATTLGIVNGHRELAQPHRDRLARAAVARALSEPHLFARTRTGKNSSGHRADLGGQYFRSAWEANYARFLNFTRTRWEYEKKTFWFERIKRGVRSYTPDFYLPEKNEYHEVKGWMDKKSATKLKRMRIYYPAVKMVVIGRDFFKAANKQGLCKLIPGWECKHKRHLGTAQQHLAPNHREKIAAALKGRQFTQEHRDNLSAAKRGREHPLDRKAPMVRVELRKL